MKTTHRPLRRGFTLVELLVVIAIIVALAALSTPAILRQKKKADMVQATSNARQIYALFIDFDGDYGSFPDNDTAAEVTRYADPASMPTPLNGTESNAQFRQLIAGNYVNSEDIFYTTAPGTKKPDNNMNGANALEAGEVGFGYVLVDDAAQSTSDNAGRPVVVTPLVQGATSENFALDPFDGRAVILRIDGSAKSERLAPDGTIPLGGAGSSQTLLSTGSDSVWGEGSTPSINPPEM